MVFDPATMAMIQGGTALAGAIGGALGGGSKDPIPDIKHIWGKDIAEQYIRPLQKELFGMDPLQYFPGSTVAPLNPGLSGAYQGMIDYGMSNPYQSQMGLQGAAGLNALTGGNQYLQNMMGQGAPTFQYDQGTFDQTMQNLMPGLQGTYEDVTRDMMRDLNFNQLPGLDLSVAGAGGFGSSRGELGRAMTQGMTADRMADVGSQLFQNALNQSQAAAMSGGQQNLQSALQTPRTLLQGSQGLAGIGLPGIGDAYSAGVSGLGLAQQGGLGLQGYLQSLTDADVNRWNFEQGAGRQNIQDILNLQNQMIGTGGATLNPVSPVSTAMQGLQLGAGLGGAFGPMLGNIFGTQTPSQPWMTPGTMSNDYLQSIGVF